MEELSRVANIFDRKVELIDYKLVKTFAPGIGHFVFDVRIGEK